MNIGLLLLLISVAVAGCGAKHPIEEANPYAERAQQAFSDGAASLRANELSFAKQAFARASQQAALAGDRRLMAQAERGQGIALLREGKTKAAEQAFLRALAWAEAAGDRGEQQRAKAWLQLARARAGVCTEAEEAPNGPWDALLAWAEAARLCGAVTKAEAAFASVLQKAKNAALRAQAHLGLARIAEAKGDRTTALQHAALAVQQARQAALPRALASAYAIVARLRSDAEAADAAFHAWKIAVAFRLEQLAHAMQARLQALAQAGNQRARLWQQEVQRRGDSN